MPAGDPLACCSPAVQAALLAMASGHEFSIQVRPVPSQYSEAVGGYGAGGSGNGSSQPPPVLTILFRPAGMEPLRQGQPEIGEGEAWRKGPPSGSSRALARCLHRLRTSLHHP